MCDCTVNLSLTEGINSVREWLLVLHARLRASMRVHAVLSCMRGIIGLFGHLSALEILEALYFVCFVCAKVPVWCADLEFHRALQHLEQLTITISPRIGFDP